MSSPSDPTRAIVVYSPAEFWGIGRRTYFELPRDADGQIKRPFRFEVARDPATGAFSKVPTKQRDDVAAHQFDTESIVSPPRNLPDRAGPMSGGSSHEPFALVLAVNETGRRAVTNRIDATLVVVPSSQPRPAAEQAAARTQAVLLTPVTAVVDVVLSPMYLGVWLVFQEW